MKFFGFLKTARAAAKTPAPNACGITGTATGRSGLIGFSQEICSATRDSVRRRRLAPLERQSWQLRPLQRFLELEGWQSAENATVAGVRVPLAIRSAENADTLAVGTYPGLLDRDGEAFRHPLHALDGEDDVRLIFLNDFVVSRDLPAAYREFRKRAGLERWDGAD